MFAITNGRIITEDEIIEGKYIIIKDDKILDISDSLPCDIEVIDAGGNFVSPGFIDIHIHGAGGYDVMDGTPDSINSMSKVIAQHGVTSFVPSTVTDDVDNIKRAVKAAKHCISNGTEGANVLGVHLEGPFLNCKVKGAHSIEYIKEPDIDLLIKLVEDDFSSIKRITISPEIQGAIELIRFIVGYGITASIGHSDGSYDEIMDAIGHGVYHSTHLYNAMRPLNHREPGVVGAIFDSRISTEIIADGIHSHFASVRLAIAAKGYKNCALISDSMRGACMSDGMYSLGGQDVYVKDGSARLSDGTLAGSTLTLDTAVKNIMKNTSLNIMEAVAMASSVPARISKVDDVKGYIKKGYDADIVVFDSDINIKTTIVGGRIVPIT